MYYPDGALKSVQEITTDSIRDGLYVQFFSDTTMVEARKTYSMGMREGMSVEYYRNGFVKSRVPYHLDKEEGTARWYYDSGGLDAIVVYKKGVKQSPGVCYFESGELQARIAYNPAGAVVYRIDYNKDGSVLRAKGTEPMGWNSLLALDSADVAASALRSDSPL
ncbi:MAG: hypothetical protein H6591_07425 [Flavobacteriales bacterium]|nr:hypothetical protein [Flavobacteriales bacterium]